MADTRRMTHGSPVGQAPADLTSEFNLAASTTKRVRLNVQGCQSVLVRLKGQIVGAGGVNLDLVPMGADAGNDLDEDAGTDMTTGAPTQVAVSDNTEASIEYILKGERYVDVKIATGAATTFDPTGAGDFVFAFVKPRGANS